MLKPGILSAGVLARNRVSRNWTPLTLVVQDATPTHVDITFPSAKTVLASDFTIAGFTVNSGSWSGVVYTLVLSVAVVYGDILNVVYKSKSYSVTNNVGWTPLQIPTKIIGWFKESEENAGQQPNKMDAGATHLTVVSGSGLNKVYTLPAGWVSADTDYCWWKTDASLSVTDGNRLIAYDFARTIVKYDSVSPYALREIIILAAGATLTTDEMNHLRDYAWLSTWWDNTLSLYGYLKGNRAGEQSIWTAESVAVAPTVTTTAITGVTSTSVSGGGNVTSDGGASVTARGVCWGTSANPVASGSHTTDGSGTGVFTSSITGLTAKTLYHFRAYATNSAGTSYGADVQFTIIYGEELVDQANWYKAAWWDGAFGAGWTENSGYLSSNGTSVIRRNSFWTVGKTYHVVFTIVVTSGTVLCPTNYFDRPVPDSYTTSGIKTYDYLNGPTGNVNMLILSTAFVGSVTGLSIKEVL